MKNRKINRMKGFDYSSNNLYFVTNCVKNNICCLGNVIHVGTGRDLSVHSEFPNPNIPNSEFPNSEFPNPNIPNSEFPNSEFPNPNIPNSNISNSNISNSNISNSEFPNSEFPNSNISNPKLNYVMQLNQFGLIVDQRVNWLMEQYKYVDIHNYVIMPNHFHLIVEIDSLRVSDNNVKIKSLSSLIGAMKSTSSTMIHDLGFHEFNWHRSFHDHIIRNENEYVKISNYIDLNPQKWFEDKFFNSF